MGFPTYHF